MTVPAQWETAKEAAVRTRQSVDFIREAVARGDLKAYAIGRSGKDYRLDAADVDEWMRSKSWEPRSA